MSKNPLQANQERLEEMRRKRAERLNTMQTGTQPATTTNGPILKRQFSSHRSQSVQIPSTSIQTYQKQIQVAIESRSLDSKPANHQNYQDQQQQVDLLQPKQQRRKKDQHRRDAHDLQTFKTKCNKFLDSELSQEELDSLVKSKNFHDFFNRSSKFLEKVLDNGDANMIELLLKDGIKQKKSDSDVLTQVGFYSDPNLTSYRVITDLDWSTQIPQLFLASYSQKTQQQNIKDHVGVVLVWTPSLRTRPEFHCFCQSAVTSAKFFPYSNSTILGGCNNGQLVIWDFRVKAMPVQRSDVSADGHKYPVNSLNVVGTQIANNVVSFSNDGAMCLWDVKQFSKPINNSKLKAYRPARISKPTVPQTLAGRTSVVTSNILQRKEQTHDVNVTCCQFPLGDVNKYYVGSLNGAMYKNAIHNSSVQKIAMYDQHEGPISSISINNPTHEVQSLSGLVLTSSYDWTVKLWSPNDNKQSIRTFEHSDDYIYDVSWNPSNPSIFVTTNNDGVMDLFDLTRDMQQPTAHVKINSNAQNKCRWNADGSIVISGDSAGNVNLLVLNERMRKLDNSRLENFESILLQNREEY